MQAENQSKKVGKAISLQRLIAYHRTDSMTIRDFRSQRSLQKQKDELWKNNKVTKSKEISCHFYLNVSIQNDSQTEQQQKASPTLKTQKNSSQILQDGLLYNDNSFLQISEEYSEDDSSFSFSDSKNIDEIFQGINLGPKIKIKAYLNQLKLKEQQQSSIQF